MSDKALQRTTSLMILLARTSGNPNISTICSLPGGGKPFARGGQHPTCRHAIEIAVDSAKRIYQLFDFLLRWASVPMQNFGMMPARCACLPYFRTAAFHRRDGNSIAVEVEPCAPEIVMSKLLIAD